MIASNSDLYHSVECISLLSCHLSMIVNLADQLQMKSYPCIVLNKATGKLWETCDELMTMMELSFFLDFETSVR